MREEAAAVRLLQAAASALLGDTPEPTSPTARRALLRRRIAEGHPHAPAYERLRGAMVAQFTPLVHSIAVSLADETSAIFAELVSDGLSALVDAVDSWRPRQGVRFMSFCYPVVRHSMLSRLRVAARSRRLAQALEHSTGEAATPEQLLELADAQAEEAERLAWLRAQVRRLSARQRQVVRMLYDERRTPLEVAARLQITQQAVSQLHGRAIRTLKERA